MKASGEREPRGPSIDFHRGSPGPLNSRNKKILVVDDEEIMLTLLSKVLEEEGYEVHLASEGAVALEKMRREKFDLVLTDLRMPGMGGMEVIRHAKNIAPGIEVIVMTAYYSLESAVEAMKSGATDYITKPFMVDQIKIVVSNAIERRKLAEMARERDIYKRLALTDRLTGLYNFHYFHESLRRAMASAERFNHTLTLLMLDIDGFKDFNDSHGHLLGDEALRKVSKIISDALRLSDVVARYGGEEFIIYLPETSLEGGVTCGEKIRAKVQNAVFKGRGGKEASLTISCGVATFPRHATDADGLIDAADQALYFSKRERNKVTVFGKKLEENH